jgi:hypothetical protein
MCSRRIPVVVFLQMICMMVLLPCTWTPQGQRTTCRHEERSAGSSSCTGLSSSQEIPRYLKLSKFTPFDYTRDIFNAIAREQYYTEGWYYIEHHRSFRHIFLHLKIFLLRSTSCLVKKTKTCKSMVELILCDTFTHSTRRTNTARNHLE